MTLRAGLLALATLLATAAVSQASEGVSIMPVEPLMIAPFVALLASIAVMPFINRHFWENHAVTGWMISKGQERCGGRDCMQSMA